MPPGVAACGFAPARNSASMCARERRRRIAHKQRRAPIGHWRVARGLIRIGAVLEQQFDRCRVVQVGDAVHRIGALEAGAVLQQQPGAGEAIGEALSSEW